MYNNKKILDMEPKELELYLTCKDYVVSRETFELMLEKNSELLITSPKPVESELMKYYESEDYISHTDSKKSAIDRIYQLVKNYTIKQKLKLINKQECTGRTILDIGCGTGDFLDACKNNGWHIKGIEPNNKARELALKKINTSSLLVENIGCLLEENTHKYDIITMWHVLEHVPNLEEYITHLKHLLKPKGTLIIALPNYKSYDAMYYKNFWAAYDVPRHLWHFSKKAMKTIFAKQNFIISKTIPMKFDAFYVSMLSEKYKSGKTNPFAAFYRGILSNFRASRSGEYSSLIYLIKNKD